LMHCIGNLGLRVELLAQAIGGSLHARIHLYDEGPSVAFPGNCEFDIVVAGTNGRAQRLTRGVVVDRGDGIIMLQGIRRRIVQVPDEPVHAWFRREYLGRPYPIGGYRQVFWVDRFWLVSTGKAAN